MAQSASLDPDVQPSPKSGKHRKGKECKKRIDHRRSVTEGAKGTKDYAETWDFASREAACRHGPGSTPAPWGLDRRGAVNSPLNTVNRPSRPRRTLRQRDGFELDKRAAGLVGAIGVGLLEGGEGMTTDWELVTVDGLFGSVRVRQIAYCKLFANCQASAPGPASGRADDRAAGDLQSDDILTTGPRTPRCINKPGARRPRWEAPAGVLALIVPISPTGGVGAGSTQRRAISRSSASGLDRAGCR